MSIGWKDEPRLLASLLFGQQFSIAIQEGAILYVIKKGAA
jgi:hypothetical protein